MPGDLKERGLAASFRRHWFFAGLAVAVLLAATCPGSAAAIERWHIVEFLIGAVFFSSGLTIRFRQMVQGLSDVKTFVVVQVISFVLFPLLMGISASWLFPEPRDLHVGFGLLLAVPTTITSCVILTTAANGTTAVALVSAVGGNLLGVLVSPFLLKIYLGVTAQLPVGQMIATLCAIVLAPVVAGQCFRPVAPEFFSAQAKRFSKFNQLVILLIVYTAAAKAIPELKATPLLLAKLAAYLLAFHALALGLCSLAANLRGGPAGLRPAILFCGGQKTLAIGKALTFGLAAQTGSNASLLMVPMVLYHVIQLLVDATLAQRLARRPAA